MSPRRAVLVSPQGGPLSPFFLSLAMPNASVGFPYSFQFQAGGGTPPYTFSFVSVVPNTGGWLSISSAGLATGTPSTAESEAIVVRVTDALGRTATAPTALTVVTSGANPGPSQLWPGQIGLTTFYLAWSIPSGPIPSGYNVYRNGLRTATNVPVDTAWGNGYPVLMDGAPPSTLLGPLTPNTTYTYTVTSIIGGVESAPSAPVTITTLANGPSAQPIAPLDPDTWIQPYQLPVGGTRWTCTQFTQRGDVAGSDNPPGNLKGNSGCSLQHAINGYAPGDVIVLSSLMTTGGQTYDTGLNTPWTFNTKANPSNLFTYVVSDQDPGLGTGGTLMPYMYDTRQGAGVTDLSNGTGGNWVTNANIQSMAVLSSSVVNGVCVLLGQGANFLRFVGVATRPTTGGTGTFTLSAIPQPGQTSATISSPGGYTGPGTTAGFIIIVFSNGESRSINASTGATTISWGPGIGYTQSSATVQWMFTGYANQYCVQMPFPANAALVTPCESIYFDRCMTGMDPTQIFKTINGGYTFSRYGWHVFCNHFHLNQCFSQGHSDTWDGQNSGGLTFLSITLTGGTLNGNWGTSPYANQPAGTYRTVFSTGEVRDATFTNASAAVTWSPALTTLPTTSANYIYPQLTGYPVNEAHAVFVHGGQYMCVQNTHIEAVTEGWFGGGVWVSQNNIPQDIICRFSFNWKNPVWFTNFSGADFKNLMEHKTGQRFDVYGNVFSYNAHSFVQSQRGRCFVFWPNDQIVSGNVSQNPWNLTTDVNLHDNLLLHIGGGLYTSGPTGGVSGQNGGDFWAPCARIRFANNLMYLDVPNLSAIGVTSTSPWGFHLGFNVPDQIWDHNTYIVNYSNPNWTGGTSFLYGMYGFQTNGNGVTAWPPDGFTPNGRQIYSDRMTVTNNLMDANDAFNGSGLSHSIAAYNTLFPAVASSTADYNLYTQDATSYSPHDVPNKPYNTIGFQNFVSNTSFPANPQDWVVTSGTYATAAKDGGPIGFRGLFNVATLSPLNGAVTGRAYSVTPSVQGGIGPYTWSLVSATPNTGNWLSMANTSTGQLVGTPGTVEIEKVKLQVTDSSIPPRTINKTFFLYVSAPASLTLNTTALPNALVGFAYNPWLNATGGVPPYTWSLISAAPNTNSWIQVQPNGAITGTPQTVETETIVVQVNDSAGASARVTLNIVVQPS